MESSRHTALVIGWQGGVGSALLALLADHPRGRALAAQYDRIVLADAADEPAGDRPRPRHATPLHPLVITCGEDLARLLDVHGVETVIELAHVGTLDCIAATAAHGADYLSTSLERWPGTQTARRTLHDARSLLPGHRPETARGSHLVGAGMNPGLVSALVPAALERFAARVGCAPTTDALDLFGIYVTEDDTTTSPQADPDAFGCTWMPRGCIDELFEPTAMYVRAGDPVELAHPPHAACYRVRCGDRLVAGRVVPHDELVTLGYRYPHVEVAFVYALPPGAAALLDRPARPTPDAFVVQRLYPPHVASVHGRDRVGVLLTSRRHGELWLGFDTDCREAETLQTNATELQVATGVLAGWRQLGTVAGIHGVEDLDHATMLADATAILGPVLEHHDPDAPVAPLASRRV